MVTHRRRRGRSHGRNHAVPMSVMGQKQTSDWSTLMSALPPKADIAGLQFDVRFVPKADIMWCIKRSHLLGHALLNFCQ
jgi:hypothetical protein